MGRDFTALSVKPWWRGLKRVVEGLKRALLSAGEMTKNRLGSQLTPGELKLLADTIDANPSDLVIAEYSSLAPVLGMIKPTKRAVLLHDLFSSRAAAFRDAGMAPDHCAIPLSREADLLGSADLLLHASVAELEALSAELPCASHIWLKPPVKRRATAERHGTVRAVFLGVRHGGNIDALDQLLTKIWPRVIAEEPEARLQIVGEIGELIKTAPAGVEILGKVPDLGLYGGADAIGLAPMRITSGVSVKIATYLELGMPVIANRLSLEGFGDALDDAVEIAEDNETFAEKLIALLRSPTARANLAARGASAFDGRLSNRPVVKALADLCSATTPG